MSTPPDPALRLLEVVPAFERAFSRWAKSLLESKKSSTPAQMRLLGALHCKGPQIMSSLGAELGVTARQVTNLVDALEAEGLVRRAAHPTDRRATVIEISAKGADVACQYWQPFHAQLAGLYRELPVKDQRELLRLLEKLLEKLKSKG
ncbi:MAG: MarR family transcriptional regulator [Planctomycetia bacterium]|nr:MarR family transcriptional regulator [Planctomycetia bacterium]